MRRSSQTDRTLSALVRLGIAATVVSVLVALVGYALLSYALSRETGSDVAAYWNAAERLRAGASLYELGAANATDLYRYAPWFAALWIPLTYLPRELVETLWVTVMVVAALLSTWPLLSRGPAGWAAFTVLAPIQLQGAAFGNVQPLLVLVLLWAAERRSGPVWVGIAASLKAVPILMILVYAGRGEWKRAVVAVIVAATLVIPMFLFDLTAYSTESGPNQMSLLAVSPPLFIVVAVFALAAAWRLAGTRFGWLASAIAMVALLPRLLEYEIGLVLIGLATRRREADEDVATLPPRGDRHGIGDNLT